MFDLGNEGSQQQQLGGLVQSNGGCTNLDGAVGQDISLQTGIQVSTPQAGECGSFFFHITLFRNLLQLLFRAISLDH
jgi:hypothetical protein